MNGAASRVRAVELAAGAGAGRGARLGPGGRQSVALWLCFDALVWHRASLGRPEEGGKRQAARMLVAAAS